MRNEDNISIFKLSKSDSIRFRSVVIDVMSEAVSLDTHELGGIGTLGEKQMHAAIKRFICPDTSYHEVMLDSGQAPNGSEQKIKKRRFVADILNDGNVYEIQTGSLLPLHDKIEWILKNTDFNVTVIHPIAELKRVNILNENNDIERSYRSPKKEKISDIAPEIYAIKDFIPSPRFSLVLLSMEAEQYIKSQISKKGARPRYKKYELIPINLLSATVFSSLEDYKLLIPEALPEEFTVKQFSKASGIRGKNAYSAVHSLCDIGLLARCGKLGRAASYEKTY